MASGIGIARINRLASPNAVSYLTLTLDGQYWPDSYLQSSLLLTNSSDVSGYPRLIANNSFVLAGTTGYDGTASSSGLAVRLNGTTMVEETAYTSATANTSLGAAVGINTNHYAIVSARLTTASGTRSGLVDIYDHSNVFVAQIIPPTPPIGNDTGLADDFFGDGFAMNDTYIAIGHPRLDHNNSLDGAIHIYNASTFAFERTIFNPDTVTGGSNYFGTKIAIDGNHLLVGVPRSDLYETDSGVAYLYDMSDGSLLHTFASPAGTGETTINFGYSVAINSSRIVIGCLGNSSLASGERVYSYDRNTYASQFTIHRATVESSSNAYFGESISMNDDYIVIGASRASDGTAAGGLIAVYNGSNGALRTQYYGTVASGYLGNAVWITSGNVIYAGASGTDRSGFSSVGTIYRFTLT